MRNISLKCCIKVSGKDRHRYTSDYSNVKVDDEHPLQEWGREGSDNLQLSKFKHPKICEYKKAIKDFSRFVEK